MLIRIILLLYLNVQTYFNTWLKYVGGHEKDFNVKCIQKKIVLQGIANLSETLHRNLMSTSFEM